MLDDSNVLKQRDPHGALEIAAKQYEQAQFNPEIQSPNHDGRKINNIVITGMGGSALAALILKVLEHQESKVPIEVVRQYDLPAYVDKTTLVIASSYSGNTEETLSGLSQALRNEAQVGIITSGGKLKEIAHEQNICHILLPENFQPRMAVIYNFVAVCTLLEHFGAIAPGNIEAVRAASGFLKTASAAWAKEVTVDKNYAKQLALLAVGKTPVFYGGRITAPVAYKWKISWNENAKNVAFWNEYPEFNHNEFMGWTSHPIEKPFAIFDLISNFEHAQILKRFEISDKLLSGRRPKANVVHVQGDTILAQILWGSILADFVSIYVAILNGVDPTPVALIEKLKAELTA